MHAWFRAYKPIKTKLSILIAFIVALSYTITTIALQYAFSVYKDQLFAIKNIAEEILSHALLSTTIGNHVLVLIEDDLEQRQLQHRIREIRETFQQYYKMDATIALSEAALYKDGPCTLIHSGKSPPPLYSSDGGLLLIP
ncbi:hypothetical protein SAMN04487969_1354 [Paenibacillus algorifonticola]|uniref:Uncharacterized protein n=1 Tax=Paenibacillus algorifonticola TaxID=684063 RepID=A0A1I2IGI5_9BACL|nr:hypothetical protein [Paenibacillus algorifonticola]SFF40750.1 hypothetical protein SAMN04487969_1354 [Paenibacillus algorifonticola]